MTSSCRHSGQWIYFRPTIISPPAAITTRPIATIGDYPQARIQLIEARKLYSLYDCMEDATNEKFNTFKRRVCLLEVIQMIGWEAVVKGDIPPPIPIWRIFQN